MSVRSVVIVVGAAGGVGRAVSRRVTAAGLIARGCDRQETEGIDRVDVSDRVAFATWMRNAVAPDEHLHGLVNCQGAWAPESWLELTEESAREAVRHNLLSVMNTSVEAAQVMRESSEGRIITIGSIAADQGAMTPSAAYAAAKGGVVSFSKSLARELAPMGITVNVVSPGPIDSPMLANVPVDELERRRDAVPVGRFVTPDEVAAAVDYLLSPGAAATTGQVIRVNGGSYM